MKVKNHSTNEAFRKIFISEKCTQLEMGHRIELDKHSVHDWLKNKNEMKFSSLEKVCKHLNKTIKIIIE
jgi:DNA-binding Xre family transcriptional regulator